MLYEIKYDNTKNIKLNAILNKTFEAGFIKEERYQELKQNILQEYNLSHIGIKKFYFLMYNMHIKIL